MYLPSCLCCARAKLVLWTTCICRSPCCIPLQLALPESRPALCRWVGLEQTCWCAHQCRHKSLGRKDVRTSNIRPVIVLGAVLIAKHGSPGLSVSPHLLPHPLISLRLSFSPFVLKILGELLYKVYLKMPSWNVHPLDTPGRGGNPSVSLTGCRVHSRVQLPLRQCVQQSSKVVAPRPTGDCEKQGALDICALSASAQHEADNPKLL